MNLGTIKEKTQESKGIQMNKEPTKEDLIKQEEREQELLLDYSCPICMEIMVDPCRLSCSHRFCISCVSLLVHNK